MTDKHIEEIESRHKGRMQAFTDLGLIMGSFEPHGNGGGQFKPVFGKTPDDDIAHLLSELRTRDAEIERLRKPVGKEAW